VAAGAGCGVICSFVLIDLAIALAGWAIGFCSACVGFYIARRP
jgi:hypothetical protein